MAYCMPRTSFLPPEAESPEVGSKTPILTTFSSEEEASDAAEEDAEASDAAGAELLPQAHSAKTMTSARASAIIFFMFVPP